MTNVAGQMRTEDYRLNCPKCSAAMEKVAVGDITVERCTSCRGLWFDARKHERLKSVKGTEGIDVGTPAPEDRGRTMRINCPVCHTPMIRMVDHQQPHVWYESCGVCHGVFFDAGEFRDYKEQTFGEWLGRWTGGERK